MSNQLVAPDAIFQGGNAFMAASGQEDALDPCLHCSALRADAPEGVDRNGNPVWVFDHCWRCGFRPGINQTVSPAYMRQQFEVFQQMMNEALEKARESDPRNTLVAPAPEETEVLKQQIAQLRAQLSAQASSPATQVPTTPVEQIQGFTPNPNPYIPNPTPAPTPQNTGELPSPMGEQAPPNA